MNVKHDLIKDLQSIEEDVALLDEMIKNRSSQNIEGLQKLLQEIRLSAISCRQKAIVLAEHVEPFDTKSVVTQKEVRELLEDFA